MIATPRSIKTFAGLAVTCTLALTAIGFDVGVARAALVVPTDIQQPGTQPGEVANLESPDKCDNCHGGYNTRRRAGVQLARQHDGATPDATRSSGRRSRSPSRTSTARATSASAATAPDGWLAGRSTPTDGSALTAGDADGVDCDICHKMTNPTPPEHLGVQNSPFLANDEGTPATGYYGSGMYVLWGGAEKLGPYTDADARHQFLASKFHRDVGALRHLPRRLEPGRRRPRAQQRRAAHRRRGRFSGVPGCAGRRQGGVQQLPVPVRRRRAHLQRAQGRARSRRRWSSSYATLPADLKAGAIQAAYDAARRQRRQLRGRHAALLHLPDLPHARRSPGRAATRTRRSRNDLPLHDMTGGNYWVPDAILYLNARDCCGSAAASRRPDRRARTRARRARSKQLELAASLSVTRQHAQGRQPDRATS